MSNQDFNFDAEFETMKRETSRPDPVAREAPVEREAPAAEPSEIDLTRDDLSDEEVANRRDARVPLSALHEQRKRRQAIEKERDELRDRATRAEERARLLDEQATRARAPQAQTPAERRTLADLDPVGQPLETVEAMRERMLEIDSERKQATERQEIETNNRKFVDHYRGQVETFIAQDPEGEHFVPAYRHLQKMRLDEHILAGVDPQEAEAILKDEEARVVSNAMRQGKNPAKVLMDLARTRGWTAPAKVAEADPDEEADAKLEKLATSKRVATSMSGAPGGAQGGDMTAPKLLAMNMADYTEWVEKHPKKFANIMGR